MTRGPQRVIRDEVLAMSAYHVQSAAGMVKLDAMENPYSLPAKLREALAASLAGCDLNRYPDPAAPALKARLRAVMGIPDDLHLLLGNGSDELIQIMIQACARPGAVIMAPVPTFVMYRAYSTIAGARFVGIPLRADFSLDVAAFIGAIREHDPAVVFISYPNNPTGNLFAVEDIQKIVSASSGVVVIDEAYQPFAGTSWLGRLEDSSNVILLRTMSKLGLAGIRLGYAAGRKEWIGEFDKVRSPYNVNVLTQCVAETILADPGILEEQAAEIRATRSLLLQRLAQIPGVSPFPSAANFVLARVPAAPAVFAGLQARGILIKNLHGMHPLVDNCLRITVGTPAENEMFLQALSSAMADLSNGAELHDRVG
jgi:histidinol-phosphate aminotransferase